MKAVFSYKVLVNGVLLFLLNFVRAENWPGWRGPRGDGTCIEQDVPTNWDSAGALWTTELPGKGHASPIVWGDRVLTVTALSARRQRVLLCLDRNTGKIIWQRTVVQDPLEKIHKENSHASSTPVTDGQRVFVTFRVGDDIVVAAHDLASGKQLWLVRPGTHTGEWGFSNEPVLYKDKVIIDGDNKGDSFLIALSRADGKTLWRKNRVNKGISYSAPFIREMAGRTQLIQCGERCVAGFDPDTGQQLWQQKLGRHHASPVLVGGRIFLINDYGQVNVIKPGREFVRVTTYELGESCYASPAISDGRVYLRGFKHLFCIGSR